MKRILLLLIVLCASSVIYAGGGYEIKLTIKGLKDQNVQLAYYFGDKQYIKDSARVDATGKLVFKGEETLPGGEIELLHNLKGKINHLHLIDSDGSLNEHQTSTHNPFGTGHLDFDKLIPELLQAGVPSDWWCIDLCFWPDAWDVTADSMKFLGGIKKKFASLGA
jgi:hypothetical protein